MTLSGGPPRISTHKTKKELLEELKKSRRRIATLERAASKKSAAGCARSESETLLRHADELASLGHWTRDGATGRYTHFSEALSRIYGVDEPADLLAMMPTHEASFDFIHPGDHEKCEALVRARRDGAMRVGEYRIVRRDGEVRHVRDMAAPLPDGTGAGFRVFGTLQDITEYKDAETALREQEITLKALMDSVRDELFIKDTEGRFQLINAKGEELFERPAGEIIGRMEAELFPHINTDLLRETDRRVLDFGETQTYETEWNVSGDARWIMVRKGPLRTADGSSRGVVGVGRDITERKRAEEALRESQERFSDFAEAASDWFWEMGPDLQFTFGSERYFELTGWKPEDVYGQDRRAFHHPDLENLTSEKWQEHFALLQRHEPFQHFEYTTRTKDGAPFQMSLNGKPLFAADGTFLGYRGTGTNISERKQAEELLRQAYKMEAVGQLTGGIAHDFNNLLAVIMGNADLAQERLPENDPINAHIDALTRAATSGAELTRQLLAFSRKQPLQPRAFDADTLVDGMIDFLRRTLAATIEIHTRHEPNLWPVDADPGQLENTILNLAINARDAMPDGGDLTIESSNTEIGDDFAVANPDLEPGRYVMLAIGDTGIGMPEEVVAHMFEPFFTTKGVGEGSGLGLSMVYGFIRQSGGHVEIESAVGQGTTVRLYLPAARRVESDGAEKMRAALDR